MGAEMTIPQILGKKPYHVKLLKAQNERRSG
jgi:hypothetical protein